MPMSNHRSFPCFCLCLWVSSPTSLQGIPGRKDLNRTSQRIPTQKVNVIATVCTALSDLGPCCPSDPTSRYCPSLCLPSDWEEAPSCPSAHEACSPLYLAYSSSGGRPRAPSRQVSMQMSPTERLSSTFPYKKQQQFPTPGLHSFPCPLHRLYSALERQMTHTYVSFSCLLSSRRSAPQEQGLCFVSCCVSSVQTRAQATGLRKQLYHRANE